MMATTGSSDVMRASGLAPLNLQKINAARLSGQDGSEPLFVAHIDSARGQGPNQYLTPQGLLGNESCYSTYHTQNTIQNHLISPDMNATPKTNASTSIHPLQGPLSRSNEDLDSRHERAIRSLPNHNNQMKANPGSASAPSFPSRTSLSGVGPSSVYIPPCRSHVTTDPLPTSTDRTKTTSIPQPPIYSSMDHRAMHYVHRPIHTASTTAEIPPSMTAADHANRIRGDDNVHDATSQSLPVGEEDLFFRKIFVGGLNYNTSDEELFEFFSAKFGPVEEARTVKNNEGLSRGFGFIIFRDQPTRDVAVAANHTYCHGARVDIRAAQGHNESGSPQGRGSSCHRFQHAHRRFSEGQRPRHATHHGEILPNPAAPIFYPSNYSNGTPIDPSSRPTPSGVTFISTDNLSPASHSASRVVPVTQYVSISQPVVERADRNGHSNLPETGAIEESPENPKRGKFETTGGQVCETFEFFD